MSKTILSRAILTDQAIMYTLPPPAGYACIAAHMEQRGDYHGWPDHQGYSTSDGRFVPLSEARRIAAETGQDTVGLW